MHKENQSQQELSATAPTNVTAMTEASATARCTGFVVKIACHTDDAFQVLNDPYAVRFKLGEALDEHGLQEEVDYTMEVGRTYE